MKSPEAFPPVPRIPRLRDLLKREFVVTVELDPPRGTDLSQSLEEAASLWGRAAGINIADCPMANLRMSPIALACLVRERVGVDTIFHITCRDRSLLGLQSELLGAWAMGVENLLALGGDPPSRGDHPQSSGVFDVDTMGLLKLTSGLNDGVDANGKELRGGTDFLIGAASNPTAEDLAVELSKLRAKIEAGAHFSQTQPVYQLSDAKAFLDETASIGFPVIVGLLPIKSHRMLRYLDENVPGIKIPRKVRERLEKTPPEGVRHESVLICRELMEEMRGAAAGVHIMPVGEASLVQDILAVPEDGPPGAGDATPARRLEEAVAAAARGGKISCRAAFGLASELKVGPGDLGREIERLGVKIVACQLGCFR
jgi:methylenetetrahydrofolate reductase (NADPH)